MPKYPDARVNVGNLEAICAGTYWKDKRYDPHETTPIYIGFNTVHKEAATATTWYVWKRTYAGSDITREEGPLIGSWDGRSSLAWSA